jgi:DNA modification methylase
MIIEKKQITDLIPAPYNPRQSTAKQEKHLKESLEKFGMVEPIIFNKQTGYIVGGHFRVRELKKLGIKEIECVIVDLNEADEKELNIRLNANTGSWDWDTLANDWDVVDLEAWGLEIPQFDTEAEELEASEDDYDVPEGGIETDIVIGDLFEIGEHRLLCGDSTDSDAVARLMNGEKADMVFTDPPYGISYKSPSGSGKTKRGDYDILLNDDKPFEPNCLFGYCDKIVTWGANHYADKLPISAMWLVWDKREGDAINNNSDCELAWCSFGGSARMFHHKWNGMIKASEKKDKRVHPTQKPIALVSWAFDICEAGKNILDLFLGSGSTMVAAHQLKRRCFGMELEPKYCAVIIDRMKKLDSTLIIKRNGIQI